MAKIKCNKHGDQYVVLATKNILKYIEEKNYSISIFFVKEELFDEEFSIYYFDEKSMGLYGLESEKIYKDLSEEILTHLTPICQKCFHNFEKKLPSKVSA